MQLVIQFGYKAMVLYQQTSFSSFLYILISFCFERSKNLNSILMYHALFLKNTQHRFFWYSYKTKQTKQSRTKTQTNLFIKKKIVLTLLCTQEIQTQMGWGDTRAQEMQLLFSCGFQNIYLQEHMTSSLKTQKTSRLVCADMRSWRTLPCSLYDGHDL